MSSWSDAVREGRWTSARPWLSIVLVVLGTAGCIVEPRLIHITVVNETGHDVVFVRDAVQLRTLGPGESERFTVGGESGGGCARSNFVAVVDEVEFARLGPEVCRGEWVLREGGLSEFHPPE